MLEGNSRQILNGMCISHRLRLVIRGGKPKNGKNAITGKLDHGFNWISLLIGWVVAILTTQIRAGIFWVVTILLLHPVSVC